MTIEFCNIGLQELYTKGFSGRFAGISPKALEDFMIALSIAGNASEMADLDFPPFKSLFKDDGTCTFLLCDGWELCFSLEISDDGNSVKVISLVDSGKGV